MRGACQEGVAQTEAGGLTCFTMQMVEDLISRLQSSVSVKCLVSCGDVEKNPGPGR